METTEQPGEWDRYLAAFDSRNVPCYRFDVLIVGGGAGGSAAALAAADGGASVGVLAKAVLPETNTRYAQGGMAAVLSGEDSFESHITDTLGVGRDLCEREVVEAVVLGGPAAVERLLGIGARFDRDAGGGLELSREGGHSHARIIHSSGDATGREMQRVVTEALRHHERVASFEDVFVLDVLSREDGRVVGVVARTGRGDIVAFSAAQVVLATGGAGQIYRETTNPVIATGDGVAMGFRAGAAVRDLEFVQFHPTCLYIAGAARVLISEIVRGAGGVLRDRHGVRFMPECHPQADLAPRDVVSRGAFARMVATGDTNVYLDLSEVDGDPHVLFPGISRICRHFRIDIARDPIPVRPGAHYMVGGLAVDLDGRTNVPGLWAVGECASSGLHGANRMGSNSLLEAVVLGERAGRAVASAVEPPDLQSLDRLHVPARPEPPSGVHVNVQDVTYSLKSLMWRQMGVERSGEGLASAVEDIGFWSRAVRELAPSEPRTWELINMLTVAELATRAALVREESRGVHYRKDFPEPRPEWCVHTIARGISEGGKIRRLEISPEPLSSPVQAS